ncbi:MAG: hypothetical protein WAV48_05055 [Candidatus Magasanikiibacteriota bacterium]
MNKKKLSLLCSKASLKSTSLREIAKGLSTLLGYRVLRTAKPSLRRIQFKYGQGVDKITQYEWFSLHGVPSLEFTTNQQQVMNWLLEGKVVFGRKFLNSSCGKGIMVMDPRAPDFHPEVDFIPCPVYTLYKKKKREFRVHVFKDQVVAVVEKRRKAGWEGTQDTKIRNLANGYVFCQEVVNEPTGLRELAIKAAQVSPSDFRGVDIGYNEKKDELFVIEVNSAPGVVGSNIGKYLEAIVSHV